MKKEFEGFSPSIGMFPVQKNQIFKKIILD
jgi:hypothetical protein